MKDYYSSILGKVSDFYEDDRSLTSLFIHLTFIIDVQNIDY